MNLRARLRALEDAQTRAIERARVLRAQHQRLKAEEDNLAAQTKIVEEAHAALAEVARLKREETGKQIEAVVTRALRIVFGGTQTFKILWEDKRGTTTARFVLVSTTHAGEVENDILDAHGGGVADVVSFVLRYCLTKLQGGKILVLDEPFRQVSAHHIDGVAEMLKALCGAGWEVLLVTHQEALADIADVKIVAEQNDGVTQYR